MKLVLQLPCHDEAGQLPATLAALPRQVPGFDSVQWLVIDDGSTDGTAEVARAAGVDLVLRLPEHRGLARAFACGLEASCRLGADVIVNVDGDNQYRSDFIGALCEPLVAGRADIVVGCRPIARIAHFSALKKCLQRLGSAVVRLVAGVNVTDATSGFRAYTREAAMSLNVYSRYTYTLETLVQAGQAKLRVLSVAVEVNAPTRPSRLMRSTGEYVRRSLTTMLRSFVIYRPLRFFLVPTVLSTALGVALGLRFMLLWLGGHGTGNVQSLILAAILIILGAVCLSVGLAADLMSVNRRLLEDIQASQRRRDWRP